jgi:hypothetical protein
MTYPIGFRYQNLTTSGYSHVEDKAWYVQTKPNTLRLNYRHDKSSSDTGALGSFHFQQSSALYPELYNTAYGKFKESVSKESQLGVAAAEWKKSLGMITARAHQLYDFQRNLRQLRFRDAFSYLTLDPYENLSDNRKWARKRTNAEMELARKANIITPKDSQRRAAARAVGSVRLEWAFGWKPMMQDMYNACLILSKDIRPRTVRGRAKKRHTWQRQVWNGFGNNTFENVGDASVQHIADIRVSNPNLALANHLGLVNPGSIAWELVPWSFVVDWFGNVGQVIASFTDFLGLEIEQPATTYVHNDTAVAIWSSYPPTDQRNFHIQRETLFFVPKLRFDPLPDLSPGRALNAISLLVQKLGR